MKERPILFKGEMVRAILEGRKVMTRRVVKPQPDEPMELSELNLRYPGSYPAHWAEEGVSELQLHDGECRSWRCPYGKPGDRLWVREGFKPVASGQIKAGHGEVRYGYAYKVDAAVRWADSQTIIHDLTGQPDTGPMQFRESLWKSPIHMPRRASRILLEVTEVRVERLKDISEAEAIAEGCSQGLVSHEPDYEAVREVCNRLGLNPAKARFAQLWQSINGPDSWAANPWVWVISFRKLEN